MDLLHPGRRSRRPGLGRHATVPGSSTSSAPTASGAATTPTPIYQYAPIDPARTYRVRGRVGDAVYLSLTVYGGPDDGRYSERIVGTVNDRMLDIADDGSFEIVLSPDPHDGAWIKLEPDAVCAITRDYLVDPVEGRRVQWRIDAVDPPATRRETDADLARRFGAALTWLRDQAAIVPIPLGEPNTVDEPYPVPSQTFGWAAGDAAYAMGSYDAGRRRGPRHRGPVARLRLLERLSLEPVPPHLRLRLRARHLERRPGRLRARRLLADRRGPARPAATPTGSRPPDTAAAASGSAGSCPTTTPPRPTARLMAAADLELS